MKTCVKCGHKSEKNSEKNGKFFCRICSFFVPEDKKDFEEYSEEKVDGRILETFRKNFKPGENQKKGMVVKASQGFPMSRPPFGYKFVDGKLLIAENFREVEEIFEEFLITNIPLTQLAKKHNFSVNGLKKILSNFTYIGKIKFNSQIHQGIHKPIISSTLFNHVQNKLERTGIKN